MHIAMNLLKADHVGVRDFKSNLSKRLKTHKPIIVTEHSRPMKVVIDYQDMMDMLDMLDELTDPHTVQAVLQGRNAVSAGKKGIPISKTIQKWRKTDGSV